MYQPMKRAFWITLLAVFLPTFTSFAAAAEKVDFAREVLPVLSNKCFACHGPDTDLEETELRLDTYIAAVKHGGINPKNLAASLIVERIHDVDDPMPPRDADKLLTDTERDTLTRWVKQGGEYAQHWAFVAPTKPTGSHTIDSLIQQKFKKRQIGFAPEADRETLARRAALVLTGLPPEPEQLRVFLADKDSDAYETFVDMLLASPRFGEHQPRYWLDAVRYGDTHGLHRDDRRGIYPYRDWVVHAMNKNLPIDKFIVWQIAGDLLPNPTLEQRVATGFVRMNPTTSEVGVIPAEFQAKNSFNRVENLGTVLLGMTLNCARCHTHKYDPIPQVEYYRLLAFFNSTAERPLDGSDYEYRPVVKAPGNRAEWLKWQELRSVCDVASGERKRAMEKQLAELERTFKASTLVASELPKPRVTKLLNRGEYNMPTGKPLKPGVLSVMGALPKDAPLNRLGLARWITSREHPIVARVLVNRIWQRTFGDGLVRTPEDFGLQGQQPTHPELLDWLAVELHQCGWDLKHMLRLMVTSRAFRQSSARRKDLADPDNRLIARGPSHRLDAEVIRDMGLWASGLLESEMCGEGIKPHQPPGLWRAVGHTSSNTNRYVPDKDQRVYRRSLYIYWKRTSPHPMLTLFDAPSRESGCVRRSRTNTPLQSLALFNEKQRIDMAVTFAMRIIANHESDSTRLDRVFMVVACRKPNAAERAICESLLKKMKTRYRDKHDDARKLIAQKSNAKKLDPVEHAAWTQVVSTILASDVAIRLY